MRKTLIALTAIALAQPLALAAEPVAAQAAAASYERAPCPFDAAAEAVGLECGFLTVPERRDRAGGPSLRIAVAVLRSTGTAPAPDPIVLLSGGPGEHFVRGAATYFSRNAFFQQLRARRDLVLFDQRGTGYSEPEFCPELDTAVAAAQYSGRTRAEVEPELAPATAACSAALRARGLDPGAYNSAATARDMEDLRRALGYGPWNLLAVSYGTRVALQAMRDTPEGIRSALLDSVVPPDVAWAGEDEERFSRSLRLVFDGCAADPECRAAFPSLEDDFYALIEDLQANPIELTLPAEARFPDGRVVLSGALWGQGVFQGLYDPAFAAVLPLFVRETQRRNREVLSAAASRLAPRRLSAGLRLAVRCHEAAPPGGPERPEPGRRGGSPLGAWLERFEETSPALCAAWGGPTADPSELRPVTSDIPTLILTGELDPITPPAYGRHAAETLSRATVVEARGLSHGPTPSNPCTRELALRFLDAPDQPLDVSCAATLPPISFVTDVHLASGVFPLTSALRSRRGVQVALGLILLVLLSAVVAWPFGAAIRRLRGRPVARGGRAQEGAHLLAFLAAVLVLVFVAGLGITVTRTAAANPYVLAFGVPASAAWLFLLPWAAAASTAAVAALAVAGWRKRWWSRPARVHYTLVATACTAFVVFAAAWGLLG